MIKSQTQPLDKNVDLWSKTITYTEDNLTPYIIKRISKKALLPNEIRLEKLVVASHQKWHHKHLINVKGYRVYLKIFNKTYLLIYNK